jgi:hypothetical protein
MIYSSGTVLLIAAAIVLMPSTAHAYIDMGTGSMIFQALVAGIVGALFTIKMYWNTLKSKLARLFRRNGEDDAGKKE